MNVGIATLRERQAKALRTTVLEAVLATLESRAVEDLSMADVAHLSGISLRTLYRYFPDRNSLLQAAGEYWYASLGICVQIAAPEDIAGSFRDASRKLGTRPNLIRALIRTETGRLARSAVRSQRTAAIRNALAPLTAKLDTATGKRVLAVINHLCSASSWVSIADESGLSDAEAQVAVVWSIDRLVDALGRTARAAQQQPVKTSSAKRSDHDDH